MSNSHESYLSWLPDEIYREVLAFLAVGMPAHMDPNSWEIYSGPTYSFSPGSPPFSVDPEDELDDSGAFDGYPVPELYFIPDTPDPVHLAENHEEFAAVVFSPVHVDFSVNLLSDFDEVESEVSTEIDPYETGETDFDYDSDSDFYISFWD